MGSGGGINSSLSYDRRGGGIAEGARNEKEQSISGEISVFSPLPICISLPLLILPMQM